MTIVELRLSLNEIGPATDSHEFSMLLQSEIVRLGSIIDFTDIGNDTLPQMASIVALTLAELTSGPLSTNDSLERGQRLERLQ